MSHKIEIKAKLPGRYDRRDRVVYAMQICGTACCHVVEQTDSYFGSPTEDPTRLLLLREENDLTRFETTNYLVSYQRENVIGPKMTTSLLSPVQDVKSMKAALKISNGLIGEVFKTRHIFKRIQNGVTGRIHVDSIKGIGDFVEFEVIIEDETQREQAIEFAKELCSDLKVKQKNFIADSYITLKIEKDKARAEAKRLKEEPAKSTEGETEKTEEDVKNENTATEDERKDQAPEEGEQEKLKDAQEQTEEEFLEPEVIPIPEHQKTEDLLAPLDEEKEVSEETEEKDQAQVSENFILKALKTSVGVFTSVFTSQEAQAEEKDKTADQCPSTEQDQMKVEAKEEAQPPS